MRLIATILFTFHLSLCMSQVSSPTKFGSIVNGFASPRTSANIAKRQLRIQYIRHTGILTNFDISGVDNGFRIYKDSGLRMVETINWQPQGPQRTFPTDMVEYKRVLGNYLALYKPECVVIENEPCNHQPDYYYGAVADYVIELQAAVEVCHSYGIKVCDGGFSDMHLCFLYNQWLIDNGQPLAAAAWRAATFGPLMNQAYNNPSGQGAVQNFLFQVRQQDTILQAVRTMQVDYINIHYYEPLNNVGDGVNQTGDVWCTLTNWLRVYTGKRTITNEVGQRNYNADLVNSMLNAAIKSGADYFIWYNTSATDDNAKGMYDSSGNLLPNGERFRDYMLGINHFQQ